MYLNCPECNAMWGFNEFEWQECNACGYPHNDDDDFDDVIGGDPEFYKY